MAGIAVDSIPYVTRKDQQLLLQRWESTSLEATPVYHGVSILVLVCVFKSVWIVTFQLYYLFDVSFFFFLKL